jgi:hypothetical protein
MKTVKTAKGRTLDMGTLAAKNEMTRAVSNLNMNARGDIIDNRGNVEISREKIQKEFYKDNVPGSDTENVSIKEDESPAEAKKPVDAPKPVAKKQSASKKASEVTEVSRTARTRDDGTQYFEVEYSDGSMQDINQ